MRSTPVGNLCWTVSTVFIPTAIFFSTFLTCVWNPRCLSMVTPKYLQWCDFFNKVEPTVTVSESSRRLSFLREKVMNSVLLPFKFSLFRQKYSTNLYILSCNISRAISDFYHYRKLNNRQHTVIYEQVCL